MKKMSDIILKTKISNRSGILAIQDFEGTAERNITRNLNFEKKINIYGVLKIFF